MTLSVSTRVAGPFLGTGALTTFPYDYPILDADDLGVYQADVLQPTTAYSVTGVGSPTGGNVIFVAPPSTGTPIRIISAVPIEQQLIDLAPGALIRSSSIEQFADHLVMMMQELRELIGNAVQVSPTSPLSTLILPDPVRGNLLAWNAAANAIVNIDPATLGGGGGGGVGIGRFTETRGIVPGGAVQNVVFSNTTAIRVSGVTIDITQAPAITTEMSIGITGGEESIFGSGVSTAVGIVEGFVTGQDVVMGPAASIALIPTRGGFFNDTGAFNVQLHYFELVHQ